MEPTLVSMRGDHCPAERGGIGLGKRNAVALENSRDTFDLATWLSL